MKKVSAQEAVKEIKSGDYRVSFNASGLPAGIYSYRLMAGSHQLQKKMILSHGKL